jgi:selenide,water dikinase
VNVPIVRLTSLAHGGGCGCKLAPSVLQQLLADQPLATPYRQLLVGTETGDDAAVWQLDDGNCIIATTDFFTPVVDDPFDFGRIAATNAISDVYAMGGKPIFALAILGIPVGKIAPETVREILKGGADTPLTRQSRSMVLPSSGSARRMRYAATPMRSPVMPSS